MVPFLKELLLIRFQASWTIFDKSPNKSNLWIQTNQRSPSTINLWIAMNTRLGVELWQSKKKAQILAKSFLCVECLKTKSVRSLNGRLRMLFIESPRLNHRKSYHSSKAQFYTTRTKIGLLSKSKLLWEKLIKIWI
jgi:hypothetical protein